MLVVISIIGILSAFAISNLNLLEKPLVSASSHIQGIVKLARAKAVGTTSAYRISAPADNQIAVAFGNTCDTTDTADGTMQYLLPSEVTITNTVWTICFNARGLATEVATIPLADTHGQTRTIEVFMGGAVRQNG